MGTNEYINVRCIGISLTKKELWRTSDTIRRGALYVTNPEQMWTYSRKPPEVARPRALIKPLVSSM
jgi:hypothetical protein